MTVGSQIRLALGALALIAGAATAWILFTSPPSARGLDSTLPETLQVDAESSDVITSAIRLDINRAYKITVTGETSIWFDETNVIDALYCFEPSSRCDDFGVPPVPRPKLLINEKALDEFAGIAGQIPFQQSHRYEVHVTAVAGPLRLRYDDTNYDDNSGSYDVTIEEGEQCLAGERQDVELPIIEGTEGSDSLNGTPNRDIILGKGGGDDIEGKGGPDKICGGDGDDIIEGGGGVDVIYGDDGEDQLLGGREDDLMFDGFDGSRTIFDGGRGNDTMRAFPVSGRNVFRGGRGHDDLFGGGRTDRLKGGRGPDLLDGGDGRDFFFGGPRRDSLLAEDGRKDKKLRGGSGSDCATFDRVERSRLRSVERRPCPEGGRRLRYP